MLSKRRLFRAGDDSGAALMIALIFILAIGLMITAILSKSGSVLQTNYLVRDTAQVQYGADAAVDRALEVLRNDLKGSPTICAAQGGTATDFGSGDSSGLKVYGNSHTMHYKCQTVNGRARGSGGAIDNNFAVVVTSTGSGALTTSNAVTSTVPVNGAIYLAGAEANGDLKKSIDLSNASLFQFYDPRTTSRSACETTLNALTQINIVNASSGFSRSCTAEDVTAAVPTFNLPAAPTGTVNPKSVDYVTTSGKKTFTCRVFLPGKYTGDLDSLLITGDPSKDNQDANYFLSGRYYLTGTTSIANNRIIFGGLPRTGVAGHADDVTVGPPMSKTGCADFATADLSTPWSTPLTTLETKLTTLWAATPNSIVVSTWPNAIWKSGIQLVMAKGASITIAGASLSLSSPSPTDSEVNGKRSVTFVAARQDKWVTSGALDSANYTAWDSIGGTVLDDSNPNAQLVINGELVAPDASVKVFASNNSYAVTRAGLVAKTADLAASASVDPNSFSFQSEDTNPNDGPSPAQRTVLITVTVDGSPFTETAVATIDNFSPYAIRVYSWRAG